MSLLSKIKKTTDEPRPRRILVYGTHGIGKSTFAAQFPHPVFIPTEDGLRDIGCDAFPVAKTSIDVFDAAGELGKEVHEYKTVVLDSVDWFEQLIWRHVCEQGGKDSITDFGFGSGYGKAAAVFDEFLRYLDYINTDKKMTVVLIAHCKVERFENPQTDAYDRYAPKLHRSIAGMLQEWCDEVLFANYRVFVKSDGNGFDERSRAIGDGQRVLHTCEKPAHLAKNRLIGMPAELPLDYAAYRGCVEEHYKRLGGEVPF